MNAQPWPEISPLFLLMMVAGFLWPLWYGGVLTAIAYLVVRRRGVGGKMIACGGLTAITAFIVFWGGLVIADGLDLNNEVVLVTCFVLETAVIIVGAVCCWFRPIIRFRTPRTR